MNLYELTGAYLELEEQLNENPADSEQLKQMMDMIGDEAEHRFDGYGKFIARYDAKINACKEEKKRINDRQKSLEASRDSFMELIKNSMQIMGKKKIDGDLFSFSLRASADALVIDDEDGVPEQFWVKQKPKLDKKAFRKYAEEHKELECCHFEENVSLVIK